MRDLRSELAVLDRVVSQNVFTRSRLRGPASLEFITSVAQKFGILPPVTVSTIYAWHDGTEVPDGSTWPLFLFPRYWQFMRLDRAEQEAPWPLAWLNAHNKVGFPFAVEETGQFLIAEEGKRDLIWRVSEDHIAPAWPDGTMLGLITETTRAFRGLSQEFSARFLSDRIEWIEPGRIRNR